MAKKKKNQIDFAKLANQFKNLDTSNPAAWPSLPKVFLYCLVAFLVSAALWYFWLSGVKEELDAAVQQESKLKTEYTDKLRKAINLEELLRQKEQVQQYVFLLEKKLPGKAEMDALLLDVNQAGVGRSLKFELFKPGSEVIKDYYVELPISVRINGGFHDMGQFVADIANLSRIVTVNNLVIEPTKEGQLAMNSLVKTFRYLDPEEVSAKAKEKKPAKPAGKK